MAELADGSDDRLIMEIIEAYERFEKANPTLGIEMAMSVLYIRLVDLLWMLTSRVLVPDPNSPKAPSMEEIFRTLMAQHVEHVMAGLHRMESGLQ